MRRALKPIDAAPIRAVYRGRLLFACVPNLTGDSIARNVRAHEAARVAGSYAAEASVHAARAGADEPDTDTDAAHVLAFVDRFEHAYPF